MANNLISTEQSDIYNTPEFHDLLPVDPSPVQFMEQVDDLGLSPELFDKIQSLHSTETFNSSPNSSLHLLSRNDEKELAQEILLLRHRFTQQVADDRRFRQSALTVIQNIYLFKDRRVFFSSGLNTLEEERQKALLLLSDPNSRSITLSHTFQHLIITRIWRRICSLEQFAGTTDPAFNKLQETVRKLNTLRNIYILLCSRLVRKLAANINDIYKQSVTFDDAVQIGNFGIARAAYRYHPISGLRFSSFAANWVYSEIQRQALKGRLIRVSPNSIQKSAHGPDHKSLTKSTPLPHVQCISAPEMLAEGTAFSKEHLHSKTFVSDWFEKLELREIVLKALEDLRPKKLQDLVRRRFGLKPYENAPQSVISISNELGVTRSSIYQLEKTAFSKLRKKLQSYYLVDPSEKTAKQIS